MHPHGVRGFLRGAWKQEMQFLQKCSEPLNQP
jgi:hypothetical protein